MNLRLTLCSIIGHSRIEESFMGYHHCTRCGFQTGDTLGGSYDDSKSVIVGHDCSMCRANAKTLTWRDRLLAKDPQVSK